jgi:hypothetical protein
MTLSRRILPFSSMAQLIFRKFEMETAPFSREREKEKWKPRGLKISGL